MKRSTQLTATQVTRLQTAIERARMPGTWPYVEGRQPTCVIAQLAALEGVSIERMASWDSAVQGLEGVAPELLAYPLRLLDTLQLVWSDPWRSEEVLRERLRTRLADWRTSGREDPWFTWRKR